MPSTWAPCLDWMATFTVRRHPEKIHAARSENQRFYQSLVERLCDLKIYAVSFGSICAPDKATLKAERHAVQCTTAGP